MTDSLVPRSGGSPRVLIAGSYGHGNCGDEAILGTMIADLRRRNPTLRFEVVAGDVEQVRRDHGVDAVSWTDWEAILDAAKRADLVLQGGGGLFFDYFPFEPARLLTTTARELTHHASVAYAARLLGKPFMLYACGVGPLRTDDSRKAVAGICRHADRITVRDEESAALLVDIGIPSGRIEVTADPAFHVRFAEPPDVDALFGDPVGRGHRPLIVACPRPWSTGTSGQEWLPKMAAALGAFVRANDARLVVVPFHLSVDDSVIDRLAAETGLTDAVRVLPSGLPYSQVAAWIGAADLVVGMRLHSIIFAAGAAVPAVAIAYDPKVRSLARSLGVEDCAIDLVAIDDLESLLDRTWEHRGDIAERLRRSSNRLRSLAERNGDVAIELLASRTVRSIAAPEAEGPAEDSSATASVDELSPSSAGSPRILFLAQLPTTQGLTATLLARLDGLRDRGIAAMALFLEPPGEGSPTPDIGIPVKVCGLDRLPEVFRAFDPDVIHLIDVPEPLAVIALARPGTRAVLEVRASDLGGFYPLLDAALGDGIEALIVPSRSHGEIVASVSVAPLPIFVVPDPLEREFRDAAAPAEIPPTPVVGWVGRWDDDASNWENFVELAARVARRSAAEFWFVASASSARVEQETLSDMIRRAGTEVRFRWFPRLDRKAIRAFYATIARSGGCLVSTARGESFGTVVLEAMSQGCPAVVPDVEGLRDLVEAGVNGWKYPPGEIETAAGLVDVAIRNAALQKTVADAAREAAVSFTLDRSVEGLLNALHHRRRPSDLPLRGGDSIGRVAVLRPLISMAVVRMGKLERQLAVGRDDAAALAKTRQEMARALGEASQYVRDLAVEREATVLGLNSANRRSAERIDELARMVDDAHAENARIARELAAWKSSRLWTLASLYWKARQFFARREETDRLGANPVSPDGSPSRRRARESRPVRRG